MHLASDLGIPAANTSGIHTKLLLALIYSKLNINCILQSSFIYRECLTRTLA